MEIKERFLPIGTVCLLKGGNKKVMILSYLIFSTGKEEEKELYDYGACQFPEGVLDSKTGIGFNHTDIEEVIFMGNEEDKDYQELNKSLQRLADDLKAEFKKSQEKKETEE